jgi:hypothetical protein
MSETVAVTLLVEGKLRCPGKRAVTTGVCDCIDQAKRLPVVRRERGDCQIANRALGASRLRTLSDRPEKSQ